MAKARGQKSRFGPGWIDGQGMKENDWGWGAGGGTSGEQEKLMDELKNTSNAEL